MEQINKVAVFAAYWGASITNCHNKDESFQMTGFDLQTNTVGLKVPDSSLKCGYNYDWWNIDQCYILLTPLSKINDEDAKHLCLLNGIDTGDYKHVTECSKFGYQTYHIEFDNCYCYRITLHQEHIDYLRSKGYDCGYMGLDKLIGTQFANEKSDNEH